MNKLLRSFLRRLMSETILKSLLYACTGGAAAAFTVSLTCHIMLERTPLLMTCLISGGVFLTVFTVYFISHFPTAKRTARRVDELGLNDRVSTMLALSGQDSDIARLQRADTEQHISDVSPKQLRMNLRTRELVTCAVCVCLAVGVLLLPYDVFALNASAEEQDDVQKQAVRALIESLREQVRESRLNDELKTALNEVVDDLEEKLENTDSELEQAAQIEKAKREMQDIMDRALTRKQIGEALQQFELTGPLGEAVSRGDTEKVSSALEELLTALNEDTSLIEELARIVSQALSDSGVEPKDALYSALSAFAKDLEDADTESETLPEELTEIFNTAEAAINAALEEQAAIEDEMEKLEDAMSDAKDELLGNEKGEEDTAYGEKPEGDMPEGEMPDGERPDGKMTEGDMPEGDMPEGIGGEGGEGEGRNTMTEAIYDPVSGNVSYGEVFAAYYAEYLAALGEGELPEDLMTIIEKYYDSLNSQ